MPQVADFSAQQHLNQIKGHGFAGIVRYVSDYSPKNITQQEFDEAISLGLSVTLVCEQGNQPALRGAPGGSHDAQIANQQANNVGYDERATIYYVAEDPNVLPQSSWPTVEEYFGALSGRPRGAYGGLRLVTNLLNKGLASKGWVVQTWGGTSPQVHLEQLVGANTFGMAIDVDNVLQADFGQHPCLSAPQPATKGTQQMIATDPVSGGFWATDPNGDTGNYNGAPFIPGLNTHPDWHAGEQESGNQNEVIGLATFKDKNGDWGLAFQTAPSGGYTDVTQLNYYRIARDGSPD